MASNSKLRNKKRVMALSALLLLIGLVLLLEATHTTHIFTKRKNIEPAKAITGSQATKGEVANTNSNNASTSNNVSTNQTQPGDNKSSSGPTSGNLVSPSGDFVSAHNVQLSSQIASVCNTTTGASCKIIFTKDGITKQLPEQATDKGGSTYWNSWTISSIGLTAGEWQISAVATLNGQSKTSNDALLLRVSE